MLISKFIGYVLIHLASLSVPSSFDLKDFQLILNSIGILCKSPSNWYMPGKHKPTPGGMQGSKFIQLVSLSYSIYFRSTSMHDMI